MLQGLIFYLCPPTKHSIILEGKRDINVLEFFVSRQLGSSKPTMFYSLTNMTVLYLITSVFVWKCIQRIKRTGCIELLQKEVWIVVARAQCRSSTHSIKLQLIFILLVFFLVQWDGGSSKVNTVLSIQFLYSAVVPKRSWIKLLNGIIVLI